jgi:phosphoribosylaminoimidazolecarboxamide formyltransferase/IMP cyclohydrolase
MLGGRVKTLHPAIHGGILARDTAADQADLEAQGIAPIDLVVCNLYPFQQTVARPGVTLAEAVEQIDIGGVTLLRAAAKNFGRVAVVCDPADYPTLLAELQANGAVGEGTRRQLALKAFAHTRDYDTAIADYLMGPADSVLPARLRLDLFQVQALRYGENPHQAAALYALMPDTGPLGGHLLQGKELSYNNLLDLDAAWRAAESFAEPAVVIVKHLSPCGLATAETAAAAFPLALASDPVAAFGGVIAVNRPVDQAFADAVEEAGLFIEAVVAPDYSPESVAWFAAKKKNCRLVALGTATQESTNLPEVRTVQGGILVQERDMGDPAGTEWRVVSRRQPTEAEWQALRFAWIAVQHVKSNGITFAIPGATVGIGGGLPSRVDAVKLAAVKARERAKGAAMASDAFFPFPDGIEEAAAAGVTAVVEPGGSVRDDEVIAAADRLGLALVFTGARHFRH